MEINKIFCQSSQNFKTWLGQEISLASVLGLAGETLGESETSGESGAGETQTCESEVRLLVRLM